MKKTLMAAVSILATASVSGCAVLYPNWGTDQNPSTSQSPSASVASPTPTPAPTGSPSPAPTLGAAKFNLIELDFDSSANAIFVVAEMLSAAENGGKCSVTLSSGSSTKSVSVKAEANATSTQCFPAYIPVSGFPKGKGTVTVSYESANFAGTSQAFGVVIP
jgi:hypothetical protein